jgi:hypothetical protein
MEFIRCEQNDWPVTNGLQQLAKMSIVIVDAQLSLAAPKIHPL